MRFLKTVYFLCLALLATDSNAALPISAQSLCQAAYKRTQQDILYDGTYYKISYPMGDIPLDRGVCTDVLIRSYRSLGIDLQQRVHEDMKQHFDLYPKIWGLTKTDTNIDHRRVPNLQVFFERFGTVLPKTKDHKDYMPGDIVTWNVGTKTYIPHIGIISMEKAHSGRYKVIHNIGEGPQCEDTLFSYPITGHYRYLV